MVSKKPRIVIIGAGMAGLTAANKLYTSPGSNDLLEVIVVEGGNRIGGRINTSEFSGDRIEMGATWIHGIKGSPIHKIAQEIDSLHSHNPWECMDGTTNEPLTVAEHGYVLNQSLVMPITSLFNSLMDFAQGKAFQQNQDSTHHHHHQPYAKSASVGSFLRNGLQSYWDINNNHNDDDDDLKGCYGNWTRRSLEEAVFAMHECIQRTYTSADDLDRLDFNAESEYIMFQGEEITIAKGYSSIIESLASVLPTDSIQLGKRVTKIEWRNDEYAKKDKPIRLQFLDGSVMMADHVIVTVSLGVLKANSSTLFDPPLPNFKAQAISRLGFGVVNKLFLQIQQLPNSNKFPFLQMAFHPQKDSKFGNQKIPWWIRKTASLCPIYGKSNVVLSWFAGKEALELETLEDEEIINGFETMISSFTCEKMDIKFSKVLKSKWGRDPLFLGSYSYVEVGSSGDDLDTMATPLPPENENSSSSSSSPPALQILFAGEATHRTHYSTTHGAYFSGLREANRLLQHYHLYVV
ncbi:probable polyamine oxidase 5 [Impatiens glandulifera]|uniref:probable polyamine oxidase 5 n=1 Tax=Impatiens glandulifera TaxID=253017 RepID=UPI001FB0E354|nr:probable polyamine oxidase 5 [Impatiens glandulifera]